MIVVNFNDNQQNSDLKDILTISEFKSTKQPQDNEKNSSPMQDIENFIEWTNTIINLIYLLNLA